MTTRTPNEQQTAAIAARGQVFVSAGAGTGKTTVLVERFVEAVCERGIDVESMLVITYTERAAGELKGRIRARLHELERHDLARSLDGAWISTIHGFCLRLLKSHPFAAGLDPRFRILDDSQGRVIRGEAFEAALNEFCAGEDPERLQLLATYGAGGLRRMLTTVYETLRSAGRELDLELGERADLEAQLDELAQVARALAADPDATDAARTAAAQAVALAESETLPERLLDLSGLRARGERAASYEEARKAVEQAALDELALQDRDLLQQLLHGFAAQYAAAKDRESALDFEDLQLHARDLLRDDESLRERERLRFRSIMVDEFQDTNRLQCELVDLLTGTRHGAVLRRRRVPVDLRLPPRRRAGLPRAPHRGGDVAAADAQLPLAAGGARGRQPPLRRRVRRRVSATRGVRRVPRSGLRHARRAARDRQGGVRGHRRPLAPRRGEERRAAGQGARRHGRGDRGRDRPPLRGRDGRRVVRGGAAQRRSCHLPRHRPRLLRPAAGRRPALVPAPAPEPLRRRGARQRARVALRRRLQRRADADPAQCAGADLHRPRAHTAA